MRAVCEQKGREVDLNLLPSPTQRQTIPVSSSLGPHRTSRAEICFEHSAEPRIYIPPWAGGVCPNSHVICTRRTQRRTTSISCHQKAIFLNCAHQPPHSTPFVTLTTCGSSLSPAALMLKMYSQSSWEVRQIIPGQRWACNLHCCNVFSAVLN